MRTAKTLKEACIDTVIKNGLSLEKITDDLRNEVNEIKSLYTLNAPELRKKAGESKRIANIVLDNPELYDRLGGIISKPKWYSFFSLFKKDYNVNDFNIQSGAYLFGVLSSHRELYAEYKDNADIMRRLSAFQIESLESIYNGSGYTYLFYTNNQ